MLDAKGAATNLHIQTRAGQGKQLLHSTVPLLKWGKNSQSSHHRRESSIIESLKKIHKASGQYMQKDTQEVAVPQCTGGMKKKCCPLFLWAPMRLGLYHGEEQSIRCPAGISNNHLIFLFQ